MPGLPNWLHPITPATIGILTLIIVFIAQVADAFISNWRQDRHDDD